ncbi:class I SAM-dependent RNA methyltransferase [Candidatus Auribacterota bacterium]
MQKIDLVATCALGIESIVSRELKELGYDNVCADNGKVAFQGTFEDIPKININLRCAGKVFWKIAEFKALTFDELFEKTKAIKWADIIPKNGKFPVSKVLSVKSKLFSKSDSQAIVKKAIVESLKKSYKINFFKEDGPEFSLRLEIIKDIAVLSINTTGESLHKRAYKKLRSVAPLKETLAAALVNLSRWKGRDDTLLMDPFCGTGTILIEAAMIAKNIAPGLNRRFVSEKWDFIPEKLWTKQRELAKSQEITDTDFRILGSDSDFRILNAARENIKNVGLEKHIFIQKVPLSQISSKKRYGTIITNPPYGERVLEKEETEKLYQEMGALFIKNFPEWSYNIITPNQNFEKLFKKKANKHRKLYNGGIKCYFYQYFAPKRYKKFVSKEDKG